MTDSSDPGKKPRPLVILLVVLAVSVVGLALDVLLVREGVPRILMLMASNLLTGGFAGALFWQSHRRHEERNRFVESRLHTISEMNHHIRNALQVLSYFAVSPPRADDEKSVRAVRDSVDRIEWALREVLPFDTPAERSAVVQEAAGNAGERVKLS